MGAKLPNPRPKGKRPKSPPAPPSLKSPRQEFLTEVMEENKRLVTTVFDSAKIANEQRLEIERLRDQVNKLTKEPWGGSLNSRHLRRENARLQAEVTELRSDLNRLHQQPVLGRGGVQ